jgi:DNA-binding response OmpR family regulator
MDGRGVLVVGETPSLGQSIAMLLQGEGIRADYVPDLDRIDPPASVGRRYPVIVVASNHPVSPVARRWARGEFPDVRLVVVGSRDPEVTGRAEIHSVALPLRPSEFLARIRSLLDA